MSFSEVYLIRHGETDCNALGIIQGHENIPLNAVGIEQAKKLQKKLENVAFSTIFSSDLARAYTTAEIVCGDRKVEIQKTKELRERCMGIWEGSKRKSIETAAKARGLDVSKLSKEAFCSYKLPPGDIESMSEIYQRFERFLRQNVASHIGEKVLLSAHGGVLKSVLYEKEGFPEGKFWSLPNCSYLKLQVFADGSFKVTDIIGPKPTEHTPYP
jgi:2,3-bisphosphoglycerate-dependent phosphoglycerate mutase